MDQAVPGIVCLVARFERLHRARFEAALEVLGGEATPGVLQGAAREVLFAKDQGVLLAADPGVRLVLRSIVILAAGREVQPEVDREARPEVDPVLQSREGLVRLVVDRVVLLGVDRVVRPEADRAVQSGVDLAVLLAVSLAVVPVVDRVVQSEVGPKVQLAVGQAAQPEVDLEAEVGLEVRWPEVPEVLQGVDPNRHEGADLLAEHTVDPVVLYKQMLPTCLVMLMISVPIPTEVEERMIGEVTTWNWVMESRRKNRKKKSQKQEST